MAHGNAIARRLDRLSDQWNEFAQNDEARILRWLVGPDEYRMIETFVLREQDDRAGEIPDLFLRLDEPFEDVESYGAALRGALIAQYEAAREELLEEGDATDMSWVPPSPGGDHSLLDFVAACGSLQAHYADSLEKLALVLTPATVSDGGEWERWLWAAAERLASGVRLAVVDERDAPVLAGLAEQLPRLVITVAADLDMPGAIAELARGGGTSGPDGQFRVKFTAMVQSLGKGDLDGARSHAADAVAVASENGWTHLVAAVHLALAGGHLSAGGHADAMRLYREADAAARDGERAGDPAGTKLRLQAGFGAGAALFAAQDHEGAAAAYEATAKQAVRAEDGVLELESWRMAGHCHAQAGDTARAWDCGMRALDAGEALPPDQRNASTLPFAGDALLRLVQHSPTHVRLVDDRMTELLGTPDWQASVRAVSS